VPSSAEEASEEELLLFAAAKMRVPQKVVDIDQLMKIRTGKVSRKKLFCETNPTKFPSFKELQFRENACEGCACVEAVPAETPRHRMFLAAS
jgi:hypothetical protein